MSAVTIVQAREQELGDAPVRVMNAVADGLADHGFDIMGPAWEEAHHFRVTNVPGALCEVIIGSNGSVTSEYRPVHGYRPGPAEVTAMVLGLLGASGTAQHATPCRYTGLTLKGAVSLAVRERGLFARLGRVTSDEVACEVFAEVEITNPRQAHRGAVWISDEGVIRWECHLSEPAQDIRGINPQEIARTIATSLPKRWDYPAESSRGHQRIVAVRDASAASISND